MQKQTIYILIISIIIGALSICFYIWGIFYVGNMGGDLKQLHEESISLEQEFSRINSIKKVAENADDNNSKINKYIIPAGNEGSINFVKQIEDLADKYVSRYTTNSIEIISNEQLTAINKEYLSVKITAFGKKSQIFNFVNKINNAPYNLKIKTFSLIKIGNQGVLADSSDFWQIDLDVLIIKEK